MSEPTESIKVKKKSALCGFFLEGEVIVSTAR